MALRTVPEVNSQYQNGDVVEMPSVDISVAVATPTGLITPSVPSTNKLRVTDIAAAMAVSV